ncbi:SIR2 family protein [Maribacter flavus]|uniref:Uncharacterized protein n=1 Tax=Maribacter flavus TaxID=1658664 RepID=A0A5B2TS91_9FLAO|nr:SIR2 family protein [Maribacter flavus]KAA2217412.1 hypothetical protein F0361_15830 [Maribacter flavus]
MIELPEKNIENEKNLCQLIASGDAVVIIGAGSSKIVGYPLWTELIQELEKEVKILVDTSDSEFHFRKSREEEGDLEYAVRLKEILENPRYGAIMHKLFDEKGCDECHIKLLRLPFRGILTTNYDTTLEKALFEINGEPNNSINIDKGTTNREINKFFRALNFGYSGNTKIAHLHGRFREEPSLVLCLNDYLEKYGSTDPSSQNWPLHKRIIWALMATRRILYLGFSMNDPFFQMMHQIVSDDLGHFHADAHFMVSRFTSKDENEAIKQLKFAERIQANYGIQTVFFGDDSSYEGLKKYIYELAEKVEKLIAGELPEKRETKSVSVKVDEDDTSLTARLKEKALRKNKEIREDED